MPEITKTVSVEASVAASEATAVADQPVECAVTPAEVSQGQENGDVLAEVAEQVPEASVTAEEQPPSDVKLEQATEETTAPVVTKEVSVANEVPVPQESEAATKEDSVAKEEVPATEELKEAEQAPTPQEPATEEVKETAQEPITTEVKEAALEPATEELKETAAEESAIDMTEEPAQDSEPLKDVATQEATEPISAPVAEEPAEVDGPAPKSVDSETLSENFKAVSLNPAVEADLTTKLEQPPTVTIDIATQNGAPLQKAEPVTIFSQAVQAKAEPNCAGPSLTSRHLSGG